VKAHLTSKASVTITNTSQSHTTYFTVLISRKKEIDNMKNPSSLIRYVHFPDDGMEAEIIGSSVQTKMTVDLFWYTNEEIENMKKEESMMEGQRDVRFDETIVDGVIRSSFSLDSLQPHHLLWYTKDEIEQVKTEALNEAATSFCWWTTSEFDSFQDDRTTQLSVDHEDFIGEAKASSSQLAPISPNPTKARQSRNNEGCLLTSPSGVQDFFDRDLCASFSRKHEDDTSTLSSGPQVVRRRERRTDSSIIATTPGIPNRNERPQRRKLRPQRSKGLLEVEGL